MLIEVSGGHGANLHDLAQNALASAVEKGEASDAIVAQTGAQARELWRIREGISEAQKREGASIKHDISVPVAKIPAFIAEATAAVTARFPGARPVTFGHVGDGNLHFNCQAPAGWDKARFLPHTHAVNAAVYDLVVSYGGSISAEHGIGLLKVDELAHYRSKVEIDTMRTIKRALDPQNLLNPGKIVRV